MFEKMFGAIIRGVLFFGYYLEYPKYEGLFQALSPRQQEYILTVFPGLQEMYQGQRDWGAEDLEGFLPMMAYLFMSKEEPPEGDFSDIGARMRVDHEFHDFVMHCQTPGQAVSILTLGDKHDWCYVLAIPSSISYGSGEFPESTPVMEVAVEKVAELEVLGQLLGFDEEPGWKLSFIER